MHDGCVWGGHRWSRQLPSCSLAVKMRKKVMRKMAAGSTSGLSLKVERDRRWEDHLTPRPLCKDSSEQLSAVMGHLPLMPLYLLSSWWRYSPDLGQMSVFEWIHVFWRKLTTKKKIQVRPQSCGRAFCYSFSLWSCTCQITCSAVWSLLIRCTSHCWM